MLLFFIIGDVIGAGIYALVGEVGGEVGGAIWIAFTVALVLALCTAFAYAELVTKYPHAGGAALFVLLIKRFVDMTSTQLYLLLLLLGIAVALWLVNRFLIGRTAEPDSALLET